MKFSTCGTMSVYQIFQILSILGYRLRKAQSTLLAMKTHISIQRANLCRWEGRQGDDNNAEGKYADQFLSTSHKLRHIEEEQISIEELPPSDCSGGVFS